MGCVPPSERSVTCGLYRCRGGVGCIPYHLRGASHAGYKMKMWLGGVRGGTCGTDRGAEVGRLHPPSKRNMALPHQPRF